MSRIAVFGAGYVGLVTRGVLRRARARRASSATSSRRRSTRSVAARCPFHEPGLDELLARNRERLTFTLDVGEAVDGAEFLFVCVGTPPTVLGRRRPLGASGRCWTSCRPLDGRPVLVMKSTVPVGTGEKVRAALDARGLEHCRLRLEPGVPRRGNAPCATSCSPTASSSARSTRRTRDARRAAARRHRRAGRAHGRRLGRDGQARLERVPDRRASASSTRSRTSARRPAPTSRRSPRAWASTTGSGRTSSARDSATGGSCFPKDVVRR